MRSCTDRVGAVNCGTKGLGVAKYDAIGGTGGGGGGGGAAARG